MRDDSGDETGGEGSEDADAAIHDRQRRGDRPVSPVSHGDVAQWAAGEFERVLRYVSGECSPGEAAATRAWIDDDARRRALADELSALREAGPADRGWRTERWVSELRSAMRSESVAAPRRSTRPPLRLVPRQPAPPVWRRAATWATAAAACLALVAGRMAYRPGGDATPAAPVPPPTYVTNPGERTDLRLPDGTVVRMAPGTTVRLSSDFGSPRRDVYLDGEAYFEVVHDSTRPFTVFAGNASARDIGTAFSVRSYPEDGATRVVVREGEVAMSGAGLLSAGDVGRLSATGKSDVRRGVRVDALLSWVDGRYTWEYDDASLAQVIGDMGRWSATEVAVSDSALLGRPFTGSLQGMSSAEALGIVAASMGLRVRRDGRRFVLHRS